MEKALSPQERELARKLLVAEGANNAFDALIDLLVDSFELCETYPARKMIGGVDDATQQVSSALQFLILSSAEDPRIIRIAQALLKRTGISSRELVIERSGKVTRRQIYFARRSDGAIKIGSSMDVPKRLMMLKTGAGPLELLLQMNGGFRQESDLHREFAADHIDGEWFKPERVLDFVNYLRRNDALAEQPASNTTH